MDTRIEHIAEAVALVAPRYDVRRVCLFGSFARGDQRESSDVDLRLECGPDITYADLLEMQRSLQGLLGRDVEIVTNPPERMRPAFRRRVEEDEVRLYGAA